jgi:hypothetical protein
MAPDEPWRVSQIDALLVIANVESRRGVPLSVRDELGSSLASVLSTAATHPVARHGYLDFTSNTLEKIAERLYSAGLSEEAQRCAKAALSRRGRSLQAAMTQPVKKPSLGPAFDAFTAKTEPKQYYISKAIAAVRRDDWVEMAQIMLRLRDRVQRSSLAIAVARELKHIDAPFLRN